MDNTFTNIDRESLFYLGIAVVFFLVLYWVIMLLLKRYGKNSKYLLPPAAMKKLSFPFLLLFLSFILRMDSLSRLFGLSRWDNWFNKASTILSIFSVTWLVIAALGIAKKYIIENYDMGAADNLKARRIYTQFNILERIAIFLIVLFAIGVALMSFKEIREIGISVFASAGVAGIIIGFSAQKMISTILAGIQIAIAQPIKLDDVVIIEGEWGRIEEITLTYVVVNVWDKRRIIVPTPYFIENPFQNWTKSSADILGTVYLYTDYNVPFDKLREALTQALTSTDLWDGEVNVLQVTDSKPDCVELRALMSAKDSSTAWDLRVYVREKLITYLQENYPDSIVRHRVLIQNPKDATT